VEPDYVRLGIFNAINKNTRLSILKVCGKWIYYMNDHSSVSMTKADVEALINDRSLSTARVRRAKRAFTTRRVPQKDMMTLLSGDLSPSSGDLVLATVKELGKHRRIEQLSGRRAMLLPGDEIIVCYGNRYAPDQFEALVSDDLGLCDLVAGGGIAAREVNRHERMLPPTKVQPIGLIGGADANPLNVFDYRVRSKSKDIPSHIVLVTGTSMNSGKTFTAASLVRGMKQSGYRVAGIKATGTGSGGDLWKMKDMGADVVLDFTDAGFSSTYKIADKEIERGVFSLLNCAKKRNCDYAIVEVADGLQHEETATLLRATSLRSIVSGVVFSAYDSLGAKAGVDWLKQHGYRVLAISGKIAQSPLAMREAAVTGSPVLTPFSLQAGALVPVMSNTGDEIMVSSENRDRLLQSFVIDFESHLEGTLIKREIQDTALFEESSSKDDIFEAEQYITTG
jgi:hypothetical protein